MFSVLCGIIVKETVNLNKIKNQLGVITDKTQTKSNSHYRKLTRFFNHPFCRYVLWKMILQVVIKQIIKQLDRRKLSCYLLMDGTSWSLGKTTYHFLTLSIIYQGISIPIFFVNLSKKGCSNHQERKRFLQMANRLYPLKGLILIADREYIGREWFVDLIVLFELHFVIRVCETDYKTDLQSQGKSYTQLLKRARKTTTTRIFEQSFKIGNQSLRMIVTKNTKPDKKEDDLIILMTNLSHNKKKIVHIYKVRWQIECMFKCLKTNGFNLENVAMTEASKIRLLMCIVIACYVLCVQEALKEFKKNNNKIKRESIFRRGYALVCLHCQKIVLFAAWAMVCFNLTMHPKPD